MSHIDFHAHILPGADHGSASLEVSLWQINNALQHGISKIVATPHFYPDRVTVNKFTETVAAAYEKLKGRLPEELELRIGAEVLVCPGLENLNGIEKLCINGTNILLIELPFGYISDDIVRTVGGIIERGYTVLLAHADRYRSDDIDRLILLGCIIQLNAKAVCSVFTRRKCKRWIDMGVVAALGSDIHRTDKKAYKAFIKATRVIGDSYSDIVKRSAELWRLASQK